MRVEVWVIGVVWGGIVAHQMAINVCRTHTVDACIPADSLIIWGPLVAVLTIGWLQTRPAKTYPLCLAMTVVSAFVTLVVMSLLAPGMCGPGAISRFCYESYRLAAGLVGGSFVLQVAAHLWYRQAFEDSTRSYTGP